jgi:hypothetical protein
MECYGKGIYTLPRGASAMSHSIIPCLPYCLPFCLPCCSCPLICSAFIPNNRNLSSSKTHWPSLHTSGAEETNSEWCTKFYQPQDAGALFSARHSLPQRLPLYFVTIQKGLGLLRMWLYLVRYMNLNWNSGPNQERFTPLHPAWTEKLQLFQGHDPIRGLIDEIEDPESIVLECMDDDVLNMLKKQRLPKVEAKRAWKQHSRRMPPYTTRYRPHGYVKGEALLIAKL